MTTLVSSIINAFSLRPRLLFLPSAVLLFVLSSRSTVFADSATWKQNPASGNWNTAVNWTPEIVPYLPGTATFGVSSITNIGRSNVNTLLDGIVFGPGASAFTITGTDLDSLAFYFGAGITNNSGIAQNFVVSGAVGANRYSGIWFNNNTAAGNLTFFTINGSANSPGLGGFIQFYDTASAANGTFTNKGGEATGAYGGSTEFHANSTAGNSTFFINGGVVRGALGGYVVFRDTSSADDATLIANGGTNSGGGGSIYFFSDFGRGPSGGTARLELFGNGNLDISADAAGQVTVGSIAGNGRVFLGANSLSVGSNNLSTTFSGLIRDDGGITPGVGGSLTKIGTGKLVLSHFNTYTGGTIVKRGKLLVNNSGGSGTGTGPVEVERGTLGGKGTIAGAVTLGTGFGSGAILAPGYVHGAGRPGALTIQGLLTFHGDGVYQMQVNSSSAIADEVATLGVAINIGAKFAFADIGNSTLPIGTVFTIINNTSVGPIAGRFSNLHDRSTFSSNGNIYQVSYEGGDGNDLTLTVVP